MQQDLYAKNNNKIFTLSLYKETRNLSLALFRIQAALVIRDFNIRGFDYSRMQKPRITREYCYFELKLGLL